MSTNHSAKRLEDKVRQIAEPLTNLIGSLDRNVKPIALRSYGDVGESAEKTQLANFDNVEGPVPWQGEWNNKE